MLVNIVQGLVVQAVGQQALDGVQSLVHGAVHLVPVAGPALAKILGLVL